MESLDKLRRYLSDMARSGLGNDARNINFIIGDIEAEISERYTLLPVDADGVPIHTGDMLQLGDTRSDVVALAYRPHDELPWEWLTRDGEWHSTAFARHAKPRTLEDVLQSAGVSVAAIEDVAVEIRELMGVGE